MAKMKQMFPDIMKSVAALFMAIATTACVSESPFKSEVGNGTLKMKAQLRGDLTVATKAAADYDQAALERNLVVYVEKQGAGAGLVKKYLGKSNIPASISLESGNYVVEAWTGDSVSASWDKKFYKAYQPVEIKPSDTQSLTLKCNIENAVVSVKEESLDTGLADLHVSCWHSRKGTDNEYVLDFGETEIRNKAKGYFMMPTVNHTTGDKETVLNYRITGTQPDGSEFTKEGVLDNICSAHEYRIAVKADNLSHEGTGGALIRLEIEDIPLIESTVIVFRAPAYELYYGSENVDASSQLDLTGPDIYDISLNAICCKGVKSLSLKFSNNFTGMGGFADVNLSKDENARSQLSEKGIIYDLKSTHDIIDSNSDETVQVDEVTILFKSSFLKNLAKSDEEYSIIVSATDGKFQSSQTIIRFANSESAIEYPAPIGSVDMSRQENIDYTAITPYRATLYGEIYDDSASNCGIRYREKDTSDWTAVPAISTKAILGRFSVSIDGLKPSTTYEYKVYCDGFEESGSRTFKTEAIFEIPNAGMEEWSDYSKNNKVLLPAPGGIPTFWDSGNHGSATMSVTLTQGVEEPKNSGGKSARLRSQFVGIATFGKFAAGNLFVGSYDNTDGTDGELTFGRPYNGSHPVALSLFANYRPGTADSKGSKSGYIAEGALDEGQIYVALTTEPVSIKTKSKQLFDPNGQYVVAYGQVTWKESFGGEGVLEKVTIPLKYIDNASKVKPEYLVIVCSASKYGDYFSGGEGSLMYVDDFELVYE